MLSSQWLELMTFCHLISVIWHFLLQAFQTSPLLRSPTVFILKILVIILSCCTCVTSVLYNIYYFIGEVSVSLVTCAVKIKRLFIHTDDLLLLVWCGLAKWSSPDSLQMHLMAFEEDTPLFLRWFMGENQSEISKRKIGQASDLLMWGISQNCPIFTSENLFYTINKAGRGVCRIWYFYQNDKNTIVLLTCKFHPLYTCSLWQCKK